MVTKATPLVSEAVEQYMLTRRVQVADNTWLNDRSVLKRFAAWCGPIQIGGLTQDKMATYMGEIVAQQKASSYNKVRNRLMRFFAFCVRRRWLAQDLMRDITKRTVLVRERLRLSPDELLTLLDHADNPRDRAFMATAMHTALRARDLTALRLRQVDLDKGELHVMNHKSQMEDVMPISETLARELRAWLQRYHSDLMTDLAGEWFLFPARDWNRWNQRAETGSDMVGPWNPANELSRPAKVVQRAMESAGHQILTWEGVHTLRRSAARAFFEFAADQGHDMALRTTASFLHHKNIATTEHYIGVTNDRLRRDELIRLDGFLTGSEPAEPVVPLRLTSEG